MENISENIISFMKEQAYKPMKITELAKVFTIEKDELDYFQKVLDGMEKDGLIVKNRTQHYGVTEKMGLVAGKLQGHAKGYGFVIPFEERSDIFIPADSMNGAMHGDRVIAKITREGADSKKCEGEIIRILERGNKTIIGVFEDSDNFGFVVPEDRRIYQDLFIPKDNKMGAATGQIVIAEITEWPEKRRNPEGKIIQILGSKGDKGLDILTIIKKYDLPEEFSEKVESYAAGISEEIPPEEYKRRRDLRNLRIVTIDGDDAKDLDDAVSIQKLDNGNYYLGVHIADVSNYVKEKIHLIKRHLKEVRQYTFWTE